MLVVLASGDAISPGRPDMVVFAKMLRATSMANVFDKSILIEMPSMLIRFIDESPVFLASIRCQPDASGGYWPGMF
jgi:hypothetical protein